MPLTKEILLHPIRFLQHKQALNRFNVNHIQGKPYPLHNETVRKPKLFFEGRVQNSEWFEGINPNEIRNDMPPVIETIDTRGLPQIRDTYQQTNKDNIINFPIKE
jgi:hypothetical protein